MREGRGWDGRTEDGRVGEEGFASPIQDCLELEPGVWIFAGRDRPGITGVHLAIAKAVRKAEEKN